MFGTHTKISSKHGIKVFAACCSLTAVIHGFEVYVDKETGTSTAAIAIVEGLINKDGLTVFVAAFFIPTTGIT